MSKKKAKPVYSTRVREEIQSVFKEECERMGVDHGYVISEYMKKFVVLNADREAFKKAILFDSEKMEFMED